MTISSDAKICRDCGCLDWYQSVSSSTWGRESYRARHSGIYRDDIDSDDGSNDWEPQGDPECEECQENNLEDINDLTPEQFNVLYNLAQEDRMRALKLLREGKEVDPETGEEVTQVERKRSKGKIIGTKVRQR